MTARLRRVQGISVRASPSVLLIVLTPAFLAGCAAVVTTTDGRALAMRSPEFQGYVERVFREQNRVATELLYAQERAAGGQYDALLGLEDALLRACEGLNELAAARRDDRRLSLLRRARLARSSPGCEAATLQTEAALEEL